MRTTIRLDDALFAETKKLADTGRTLAAVIEDALRDLLARPRLVRPRTKVKFTTFGGKGLRPGIHLDNSAGLLELMDSSRDPG